MSHFVARSKAQGEEPTVVKMMKISVRKFGIGLKPLHELIQCCQTTLLFSVNSEM